MIDAEWIYYVYILLCNDNSYYIGVTNNIIRRLSEHKTGFNEDCYTYSRRPLICVYREEFGEILIAIAREKQLKRWSRKKKEALIHGRSDALPTLAEGKGHWHRRWKGGRGKKTRLSW